MRALPSATRTASVFTSRVLAQPRPHKVTQIAAAVSARVEFERVSDFMRRTVPADAFSSRLGVLDAHTHGDEFPLLGCHELRCEGLRDRNGCPQLVSANKKAEKSMTEGLEKVKGYIRKQLAKTIELRRVPELEFFYDDVFENGMHFEKVLKGIKDEQ